MTVSGLLGPQTAESLAERFDLEVEAFDPTFGVVCVDPNRGIHAVRMSRQVAMRLAESGDEWSGPFSDPGIHGLRTDPADR